MTLLIKHLEQVDNHWAVKAVGESSSKNALQQASECLVATSLQKIFDLETNNFDYELFERLATAL